MKLAEFKKQRNLTDEGLASLIGGCSVWTVRKWMNGERIPREDQMLRIFEATDRSVRPDDFYNLPTRSTLVPSDEDLGVSSPEDVE